MTIYIITNKSCETKSCSNSVDQKHLSWSEFNIAVVQQVILQSLGKSIAELNIVYGITETSIWKILNKDLGIKPYCVSFVWKVMR